MTPDGKERYCYRDFKDNPSEAWIDGVRLLLCKGCAYDIKAIGNFLRANGLGLRQIVVLEGEEIEGVVKGENGLAEVPRNKAGKARHEAIESIPMVTVHPDS